MATYIVVHEVAPLSRYPDRRRLFCLALGWILALAWGKLGAWGRL